VFFNGQSVRVRGVVKAVDGQTVLASATTQVTLAGSNLPAPTDQDEVEVLGVFVDVGRLTKDDPRLRGIDVTAAWREKTGRTWPGDGELLALFVDSFTSAEPFTTASLRALALAPQQFVDRSVTLTGRFRGRNLFGDQPDAPGRSRWDFVIQSADASVWVVGRRPRGEGFSLDVDARLDSSKWVEVTGTVAYERGLVLVDAGQIRLAAAPKDTQAPSEPVARVPAVGPRPEVVFSAPTADEVDVALGTTVRIQFSRDINPATFKGQVTASYAAGQSTETGEPQPPPLKIVTSYNEGLRTLEVRFDPPLARFRTVTIRLGDGIAAFDNAQLVPYTLSFTTGG
jgi:hypothetical protein